MSSLASRQWGQLAQAIREGKCLVFLGPDATVNYGDHTRQARFLEDLAQKNPHDILAYHSQDGFLVFKDHRTRSLYEMEIRDFYLRQVHNPMLDKLAAIPFHTAISMTPDHALRETFHRHAFPCFSQHYATKVKLPLHQAPSAQCPLLYNLLGSVSDPHTIVCTHADLFSIMQSIYADKNLPDDLTALFDADRTRSIIFLGFEFDKWYFQLLLHILGIRIDTCWRYAVAQQLPASHNKTLFESQFEIEFVSHGLMDFVDQLHAQFSLEELRMPAPGAAHTQKARKGKVLQFITKAFSPSELEVFCLIHFEEVQREFTPEMSQTKRIALLMDHLERTGQYGRLLEAGRQENPYQYQQCGPYYEQ